MYITICKKFYDNNGIEYSCADDIDDIKVHKKFDSAKKYHQDFLDEFRDKYGKYITNSPHIICEGKDTIMTEIITTIKDGTRYRTLLITIKKNYED